MDIKVIKKHLNNLALVLVKNDCQVLHRDNFTELKIFKDNKHIVLSYDGQDSAWIVTVCIKPRMKYLDQKLVGYYPVTEHKINMPTSTEILDFMEEYPFDFSDALVKKALKRHYFEFKENYLYEQDNYSK